MKAIIILTLIFFCFHADASKFYFSNLGNDANTSGQAQDSTTPWATIAKFNSMFSSFSPGDSIFFKRGHSFYGSITISRSGGTSNPIFIGAYGTGARPVITSLIPLTWTSLGSNLWRSIETIIASGTLSTVTHSDTIIPMGRWPNLSNGNNGYNTIANATTNTLTQKTGTELTGQPLIYPGAWVVYRPESFQQERERITAYDSVNKKITFALGSGDYSPKYDASKKFGYFIENDSATLDQQYEWWYNTTIQKLKMYSVGSPTNVKAATLKILLTASSKSWITIDNLNFNGSDSDCIRLSTVSNITVQNCIIQNVGRNGIKASSSTITVTSDSIVNICSKGIVVAGSNNYVTLTYNTIHSIGQLIGHNNGSREDGATSHTAVGIYLVGTGNHALIKYNVISLTGYNGIHFKKYDSVQIINNRVDSFNNVLDDGGGIYAYTGAYEGRTARGRKVIGNIVSNGIGAPKGGSGNLSAGAGIAAIYFDRGVNDVDCDSNSVFGSGKGIFLNYGNNHVNVRHNTMWDNTYGIQISTRLNSGDTSRSLVITNNVMIARLTTQKTILLFSYDGDMLTKFGTIDYNYYARPLNDNSHLSYQNNIGTSAVNNSLPAWQTHFPGYDVHSSRSPFKYTSLSHESDSTAYYLNDSIAPKTIFIADSSQDIYLTRYAGLTTLNRSLFLFKVGGAVSATTYTLTVNLSGSGSVSKTPNQASYASGSTVSLIATPATGYLFSGWSGDASGTSNELTVTMSANKTVTATFTAVPPAMYGLTLINVGSGSATASPTGPDYSSGASVTITATPSAGYMFTGWSGDASGMTNPLSITMTADKTITATYEIIKYTLTTSTVGSGSVTKSPALASYDTASVVTLTATPASGYEFTGWSGDASGTTNPYSITMNGNKSVTATFTAIVIATEQNIIYLNYKVVP
jgi:uncharacterized repeat protein (TIGR02543 family)